MPRGIGHMGHGKHRKSGHTGPNKFAMDLLNRKSNEELEKSSADKKHQKEKMYSSIDELMSHEKSGCKRRR